MERRKASDEVSRLKGHAFRGEVWCPVTDGYTETGPVWTDECECGSQGGDNFTSGDGAMLPIARQVVLLMTAPRIVGVPVDWNAALGCQGKARE